MDHRQAKGVLIMLMFVMLGYAVGMSDIKTALLQVIVIQLGNMLNVLCKILNRLEK